MKFAFTITGEYEVPDGDLEEGYGTTDPRSCAEIDARNAQDEPQVLLYDAQNVNVTVTPA
jgi:hypothetical protein